MCIKYVFANTGKDFSSFIPGFFWHHNQGIKEFSRIATSYLQCANSLIWFNNRSEYKNYWLLYSSKHDCQFKMWSYEDFFSINKTFDLIYSFAWFFKQVLALWRLFSWSVSDALMIATVRTTTLPTVLSLSLTGQKEHFLGTN